MACLYPSLSVSSCLVSLYPAQHSLIHTSASWMASMWENIYMIAVCFYGRLWKFFLPVSDTTCLQASWQMVPTQFWTIIQGMSLFFFDFSQNSDFLPLKENFPAFLRLSNTYCLSTHLILCLTRLSTLFNLNWYFFLLGIKWVTDNHIISIIRGRLYWFKHQLVY